MALNFPLLFATALIPLIVGWIWYNPSVFGNTLYPNRPINDSERKGHSPMVYIATYIFGLFISFNLLGATIHQYGIIQLFAGEPGFGEEGTETMKAFNDMMSQVAGRHRSIGHGVLHGVIHAITIALPVTGIIALFQGKGFKYIMIHTGYFVICFGAIAAIISAFM